MPQKKVDNSSTSRAKGAGTPPQGAQGAKTSAKKAPQEQAAPVPDTEALDDGVELPSRKGLLQSAGIVFIVVTHVVAFMAGYYLPPPQREFPTLGPVAERNESGEQPSQAVQQLGAMPGSYLDQKQASDMLALIVSHPGRKLYELRFTHAGRRFTFTADLLNQMLTRTKINADGSGSITFWEEDVLDRLQSAAKGGSFNLDSGETPRGKTSYFAADARVPLDQLH